MNRTRLLNLLGVAIGVAGIVFVTLRVIRDRAEISDALRSADLGWLVVAYLAGTGAMALIGINWLWIIRATATPAPIRRGLSWFFVGQLGKYVPGGIWPIVGQAELAHRGATPRAVAYSSTAMSMVATFLGAATVGAVAGLIAPPDSRWVPMLVALGVVVVAIALSAPPLREMAHRVGDRVTKRQLRLPSAQWMGILVARHLPVWILFSGINLFTMVALGARLDAALVFQLICATCLSWMAGFVIVGVPGGIGVRETVFISLMTAPIGGPLAVSVAVVARVVSIVVDLAAAAVSVPVARSAPRPETPPRDEAGEPKGYAAP
ncbi:MAG: lysylphosphatidylglycerol synthase transmembrane domain-containing protein [Ilumatobacteraceae bacterium]